jgi:2-polyprenyl-6-methoxyphenol hydroxylase-like FAD-dependent oxidoreductase
MEEDMKRAIVIGGSLGGLLAANMLHHAGWRVDVFERVGEELAERGAGVVTHAELESALRRVGIRVGSDLGIGVPARITLDRDGTVISERAHPQVLTAWGRLYSLLKDHFPPQSYHPGKQVATVRQQGGTVTAGFTDGSTAEADLLIAADGIRSTVRQQFLPEVQPQYAGYIAWRGLVDESALSPHTHAMLFNRFGFCLPPREQMLGYPVAGAHDALAPGQRRYNFVWYRPADAAELRRLSTDNTGRVHENGIPPPLISKMVMADMRRAAAAVLAPQFAEVVAQTRQPFFQPIYDLESPDMAFRRVVLLGDSAFVARPHCGMGVTKAAGDAVALVDQIGRAGVELGVRLYSEERVAFGRQIVAHARHLGAYMQAQLSTERERDMAARYRTPDAVMTETAVAPDFSAH